MKKNIFKKVSDEKLVSQRNLLKGASFGLGLVAIIAIAVSIFILLSKEFEKSSLIAFIPVFVLPIIFMPMFMHLNRLNKEIKSRNIE